MMVSVDCVDGVRHILAVPAGHSASPPLENGDREDDTDHQGDEPAFPEVMDPTEEAFVGHLLQRAVVVLEWDRRGGGSGRHVIASFTPSQVIVKDKWFVGDIEPGVVGFVWEGVVPLDGADPDFWTVCCWHFNGPTDKHRLLDSHGPFAITSWRHINNITIKIFNCKLVHEGYVGNNFEIDQ